MSVFIQENIFSERSLCGASIYWRTINERQAIERSVVELDDEVITYQTHAHHTIRDSGRHAQGHVGVAVSLPVRLSLSLFRYVWKSVTQPVSQHVSHLVSGGRMMSARVYSCCQRISPSVSAFI